MTGHGLFVYGTLLDPTLAHGLLERAVESEPARLLDFELLRLEGFPYPAAFHAPGESVEGRLLGGLSDEDLARLDAYEGVGEDLYRRVEAAVATESEGRGKAFAYVPTERTLRRFGAL